MSRITRLSCCRASFRFEAAHAVAPASSATFAFDRFWTSFGPEAPRLDSVVVTWASSATSRQSIEANVAPTGSLPQSPAGSVVVVVGPWVVVVVLGVVVVLEVVGGAVVVVVEVVDGWVELVVVVWVVLVVVDVVVCVVLVVVDVVVVVVVFEEPHVQSDAHTEPPPPQVLPGGSHCSFGSMTPLPHRH